MRLSRLGIATITAALLAACGEEAPTEDGRAATGEVLEGTISDAMLPLDQVRSQPPLVEPRPRSTGADEADGTEASEGPAAAEGGAAPGEIVAPVGINATSTVEPAAEADE